MPSEKYENDAAEESGYLLSRPPSLSALDIPPRPRRHQSHTTSSPSTASPMTAMSYGEWKREPSAWDILFRLHLPYRPPRSKLAAFLWRRRLWVETTFALSMMQPWEKIVVGACCPCLLRRLTD